MTLKTFTLPRLKGLAAFLGFLLTSATLIDWGFELPKYVSGAAALLTAVAVYVVPNIAPDTRGDDEAEPYEPRHALVEEEGEDALPGL